MLSRKYTFGSPFYFKRAKEKGTAVQSKNMALSSYKRKDNDATRFGFVISRKISGLAVQRNRLRRAMSETARQNLAFVKKGYDIVFLAKPNLARCSTEQIMKETSDLLKNAKLLK